jgi:hypothetical protein
MLQLFAAYLDVQKCDMMEIIKVVVSRCLAIDIPWKPWQVSEHVEVMVQKVAVSHCFTSTTELRFSSFLRQWRSWCLEMCLWLQPVVGFVLC